MQRAQTQTRERMPLLCPVSSVQSPFTLNLPEGLDWEQSLGKEFRRPHVSWVRPAGVCVWGGGVLPHTS